jgi:hypothetical protein
MIRSLAYGSAPRSYLIAKTGFSKCVKQLIAEKPVQSNPEQEV